jgi:hypothetical protein
MIYEAVMSDLEIYKDVKPAPNCMMGRSLNLILEEINKPQYIVCESSGRTILLEEAIFMDEQYLISEGILEKVGQKIKQIIDWIKEGIKEVLSKASDMIKAFCEKVKENAVVKAIRKKLNLDEKLKLDKFKNFVKVKAKGKEINAESILNNFNNNCLISEATKLNKKEEAITDPKELEPLIQKWEDALSGKKVINNAKTGQPLSKKYCQDKLRLLKKKLESLNSGNTDNTSTDNTSTDNSNTKSQSTDNSKKSSGESKPVGEINFDVEGIKNTVNSVKEECTSEETVNSAAKNTAVEIGGDDAAKVIGGNDDTKEEPKKKGFFNKIGTKIKSGITKGFAAAKKWFNAQNKWVKILICCIIAVLAILAIYFLITTFIWPIIYNILHGGILNALSGSFRIIASGKTFIATYKQGKKSWESGEGWGKTFMMIGLSILALINLGNMASAGSDMMAADGADSEMGLTEHGKQHGNELLDNDSSNAASGNNNVNADVGDNGPFDLNGDGKITQSELTDAIKNNKIPGIDVNDPKYSGTNGRLLLRKDLLERPEFKNMYKSMDSQMKTKMLRKFIDRSLQLAK